MLLRENAWNYDSDILGTDISLPRLVTAKRGRYSEWAMRATPRPLVTRYFEQSGKQYHLRREVRAMVQFRAVNLVSDSELPAPGSSGMDLIFCRNVLIYFSMETVARVAERLLASLAPDGWLIISASDPPLTDLVRCETVTTTAGLAYRRANRPGRVTTPALVPATDWTSGIEPPPVRRRETPPPAVAAPVPRPAPTPDPVVATVEVAYAARDFDRAAELAAARVAAGHDDERTRVLQVRALANRARLDAAGEACASALDQFPLSPELHLLHATLLARAGHFAETAVAARRALYLDPTMVMAHIAAADAMTRLGDARGAERALRTAAETLADLSAEESVPAADGETAGRLRQLIAFHLKALGRDGSR
jgi:chemotaxis protein methyltransferase CheR